jgi:phosphatidylcholine synthase
MIPRLGGAFVHLLTASGAVLALLALRAATQHDWQMMFLWLGIALIVDAIDGPIARRLAVETVLPRFSGERLDLIVDYLTYVVVPAYALTEATILPEVWRLPAAAAILLSSLYHVVDLNSKTEDGYFVGFPAIWNVVLLYLFALSPRPAISLAIVGSFVALTFVPFLAVHPFRVARLRAVTCIVTALWAIAAGAAIMQPFPSPIWVQVLLVATAIYLSLIGLSRWFTSGNVRGKPS